MAHTVYVISDGPSFSQTIRCGDHIWRADEPQAQGGGDQGPTPYELLAGALGACTSMTVQMYARRKQWPLQAVRVELNQERIHASDCSDCEQEDGFIHEIEVRLAFEGDLTTEQRHRLLEIAGKCPVKRTLEAEIKIRSREVPAGGTAGGQ